VVDLYDQSLARLAEALFIKARVVDIPVFVPFKESYTPAELVLIMKSDFAVTAPECVKCPELTAILRTVPGTEQSSLVGEILLSPGDSTRSVTTLPDVLAPSPDL
jgi:hypothetical protein